MFSQSLSGEITNPNPASPLEVRFAILRLLNFISVVVNNLVGF